MNLRKSERVPSRLRCWCEGENVTVYARIGNLSEGGLFLRTRTPLALGSSARLRFGRDDETEVKTAAIVVWARGEEDEGPAGMGLRFEQVEASMLEQIRRIISDERSALRSDE